MSEYRTTCGNMPLEKNFDGTSNLRSSFSIVHSYVRRNSVLSSASFIALYYKHHGDFWHVSMVLFDFGSFFDVRREKEGKRGQTVEGACPGATPGVFVLYTKSSVLNPTGSAAPKLARGTTNESKDE